MMKKDYLKIIALIMIAITTVLVLSTKVNAEVTKVAKIGDIEYDTLVEAIENVPTDGTLTTITLLKTVNNGTGFVVEAGKNIIIDFNNYSYDASNPLVGSSGTETNGCQLLKGSTVTLKNGILVSSSAAILIQNYCNLTLKDMNISATNAQYVSSNNCGNVNIIGNTSITAKAGENAFDMCWAPNKGYPEGTQITVDTTGTITGKIELGLWGTFSDTNGIKSTLNIKNINHVGTIVVDPLLEDQLSIEGGTYSSNISNYVTKVGYIALKVSDTQYKVGLKATDLTIKSNLALMAGESVTLGTVGTPTNSIEKVTYTTSDPKIANVDENGKVTAVNKGEATITATVGNIVKKCTVNVAEVVIEGNKAEISETAVDKAITKSTESNSTSIVLSLKEEGKTVTTAEIPAQAIQDVKATNKTLEVQTSKATISLDTKTIETIVNNIGQNDKVTLKVEEVKSEALNNEQKNAIKDKDVAMILSGELIVGAKTISNFNGGKVKIKISFTPPEGTEGKDYKIIYIANDGTVEEVTTQYENGYLIIELNHFSKYAVVKEEAKVEKVVEEKVVEEKVVEEKVAEQEVTKKDVTPKTGDANYLIIVIATILTILFGTMILANKKNH